MILAGNVLVEGRVADKAGSPVHDDLHIEVVNTIPYVSRGGTKLEKAIEFEFKRNEEEHKTFFDKNRINK